MSFQVSNQAHLGLPRSLPPSLPPSLTLVGGTAYGSEVDTSGHAVHSPALHLQGGREGEREEGRDAVEEKLRWCSRGKREGKKEGGRERRREGGNTHAPEMPCPVRLWCGQRE